MNEGCCTAYFFCPTRRARSTTQAFQLNNKYLVLSVLIQLNSTQLNACSNRTSELATKGKGNTTVTIEEKTKSEA